MSAVAGARPHLRAIVATSGLFGLFPLSLSPIMVSAGQAAGLSELAAGAWVTSMLLGVAAAAIGLGAISERLSLRRVFTGGAALVLATQALEFALSPSPLMMCMLAFLTGLGFGCGIVAGDVVLARTRNPMATAGFAMAITSAAMLGVFPAGMALAEAMGGQAIAVLAAGSALVAVLLTTGIDLDALRHGGDRSASCGRSLDGAAILLLVCLFLFWTRDGMVWSFAAIRASAVGFAPESIGLILGIAGACGVVGSAVAAWLASVHTFSRSQIVLACVPPALVAATWSLSHDPLGFVMLQLSYNALQLFAYPLLIGVAAQLDGTGRLAAIGGGMTLLGSAAGPMISAAAAQGGSGGLSGTVAVIGLTSVLAAGLALAPVSALRRRPAQA